MNFSDGQPLHIQDISSEKELESEVTLVPLNNYKTINTLKYDG